jgi:hypothetical protein
VAANASAELSRFSNDLAAKQEPLGVQITAEDLESAYIRSEPSANASAELQNDLSEMLRALGMSDAAQPRSPHEVFQSAIAEMKRRLANASAEARLREALDRIPQQLFWIIGKGRLRAEEPLYGVQIKDGCETIAEGEHDDLISAISVACDELAKSPCPYCTDKYTGLPGNACENCMNTGSAWPEALSAHPLASDCDKQGER